MGAHLPCPQNKKNKNTRFHIKIKPSRTHLYQRDVFEFLEDDES